MTQNNRTLESAINRLVDNLTSQEEANGSRELFSTNRPEQRTDQPGPPVVTVVEDDRRLFESDDDRRGASPEPEDEQGPSGLQLQNEFKQLHLLTQYLEPAGSKTQLNPNHINMTPATRKEMELAKVRANYLEKTDRIDKMAGHRESLVRAVQRDRIPAKLRVNNKPIVLEGDCPVFQKRWKDHARQAELGFVDILTTHLKSKINLAKTQLAEETEKSYVALRSAKLPNTEVNHALNHTLEEANKERNQRNEARKKRRLENQANQNKSKKPKKD